VHTERDTPITEPETMPDHAHLLVPVDPQTNSYFAATADDTTPEDVKRHVENQHNAYTTPLPPHG
jgi:REP element-mobilizing transposase RayT